MVMLFALFMDAEREIVKFYYSMLKQPYISEINAGKRIVDFVLFEKSKLIQVEVSCSLTKKSSYEDVDYLKSRFEDASVIRMMNSICSIHNLSSYEKRFITSLSNVSLEDVDVVPFDDILLEVLRLLDTQHYSDGTIRGLQIIRHLLLQDPAIISRLYDTNILRKKHIRNIIGIILDNNDIIRELSSKNKTIIMNSLLDGNDDIIIGSMSKQRMVKLIQLLSDDASARKIMRESLTRQQKLS